MSLYESQLRARPVHGVEGGGVGRQPRQRGGREWGGSGSLVRRISVGLQGRVAGQQLAGRPPGPSEAEADKEVEGMAGEGGRLASL